MDNFFKTNILNTYISKHLLIIFDEDENLDNYILENYIPEDDNQPYTGNLFLKHPSNNLCTYTIISENIKEIYVYDDIKYDKHILHYIIYVLNVKKLNKDLIRYIYTFLKNGKYLLYKK